MVKHRYVCGQPGKYGTFNVLGVGKTPKSAWKSARRLILRRTGSLLNGTGIDIYEMAAKDWKNHLKDGLYIYEISEDLYEVVLDSWKNDLFDFECKKRLNPALLMKVDPAIAAGFTAVELEA